MPIDYRNYPDNWKELSRWIREDRAKGKCEDCGAPNGEYICRKQDDPYRWIDAELLTDTGGEGGIYEDYSMAVKVVLTVAHLWRKECTCDHKCGNPEHLKALCQRCHLVYDLPHHMRNAAETRRRKKEREQIPIPFEGNQ